MFREIFLSVAFGAGVTFVLLFALLLWIYFTKRSWLHVLWIMLLFPLAVVACGYLVVYPSINYNIDCKYFTEYKTLIEYKDRYIEVPQNAHDIHGVHSMSNWDIAFSLHESELVKYFETRPNGITFTKISEDEVSRVYRSPIAPNGAHIQYKVIIGENIVRCSGVRW